MAGKPGLRAVHLPDSIDNRDYLFQPEFVPLLARIEELGYPILFHNLNSDLFGKRPADAGLDNTFAHAVLAAQFISTGTLDRFPKLEVVLPRRAPERAAAAAVVELRPWIERRLREVERTRAAVAARTRAHS